MADADRPDGTGERALAGSDPTLDEVDPSVLHLSPEERDHRGVTDGEVREAFLAVARYGDAEQKDLRGVHLPSLPLDRITLDGADRYPIDLRGATVDGLSAEFAVVRLPLRLEGATVGELSVDEAQFEAGLLASEATVTGDVSATEALFDGDVAFDGATFEGTVDLDEARFRNDVTFDGATFEAAAQFRVVEFYGASNLLEDNSSFRRVQFRDRVDFRQAEFGYAHFEGATFAGDAVFEEVVFGGDVAFTDAVFETLADFDETRFREDVDFGGVRFQGTADFEGAVFSGGQRSLEDDASFEGCVFADVADFYRAKFRGITFANADFEGVADFEAVTVTDDAEFPGAHFADEADFDEARFDADANFREAYFEGRCVFRGAEIRGGDNYLEDDAIFEGAYFGTDADFHETHVSSVNFMDTSFGGEIDFSGSVIEDRIDFRATEVDDDAFVDFTRAKIRGGRIVQPAEGWVRYDLTLASIGDITFDAERDADGRQLLDYVRFCRTEFAEFADHEFDFSAHRDYLDRNAWTIHTFDEPPGIDVEYAREMTPEVVETTYLKAKQAAAGIGDMKVAGEFRVKRQQYSRAKNAEVVRDSSVGAWPRVKNAGRVAENYFLGATCGHGMRPIRIAVAFLVAPLLFVVPYAFGGPAFATTAGQLSSVGAVTTPEGQAILYEIARFSYVSYTTIGYGFLGPEGPLAELLAGSEAFLSTVLAALLVYALVKRSEL